MSTIRGHLLWISIKFIPLNTFFKADENLFIWGQIWWLKRMWRCHFYFCNRIASAGLVKIVFECYEKSESRKVIWKIYRTIVRLKTVGKIFHKTSPWYYIFFLGFFESIKSSLKHHQWKIFVSRRLIFLLVFREFSMDKRPLIRNFENDRVILTHLSSLMKASSAKFGVVPLTIWFKMIFGLIHITVRSIFLKSFAYHISPDRKRAKIPVKNTSSGWPVTLRH